MKFPLSVGRREFKRINMNFVIINGTLTLFAQAVEGGEIIAHSVQRVALQPCESQMCLCRAVCSFQRFNTMMPRDPTNHPARWL